VVGFVGKKGSFGYGSEYKIFGDERWGCTTHRVFLNGKEYNLWRDSSDKESCRFYYMHMWISETSPTWFERALLGRDEQWELGAEEWDWVFAEAYVPLSLSTNGLTKKIAVDLVNAVGLAIERHSTAHRRASEKIVATDIAKAEAEQRRRDDAEHTRINKIRNLPRLPE
jgi:hypothetical protein